MVTEIVLGCDDLVMVMRGSEGLEIMMTHLSVEEEPTTPAGSLVSNILLEQHLQLLKLQRGGK